MKVKPLSPKEINAKKLPDFVLIAFNELIQEKWNGTKALIYQKEAVKKVINVSGREDPRSRVSSDIIFKNHWLDVEETYRSSGWKVSFDQPAYCESYEAYWEFTK